LVLDREASPPRVVVDTRARLAGRGAWLHRDERCVSQAIRRGNLARAFRLKGAVAARALEGSVQSQTETIRREPVERAMDRP
jgi:predicted RNA-binding protein YlxR (DUF448 family)